MISHQDYIAQSAITANQAILSLFSCLKSTAKIISKTGETEKGCTDFAYDGIWGRGLTVLVAVVLGIYVFFFFFNIKMISKKGTLSKACTKSALARFEPATPESQVRRCIYHLSYPVPRAWLSSRPSCQELRAPSTALINLRRGRKLDALLDWGLEDEGRRQQELGQLEDSFYAKWGQY